MILSISEEVVIFLWSVLSGAFIMLTYDIFSAARNTNKFSVFVCNVCDGVFVTSACAIMIFVLFSVSNGYVRGFEFAGAFIGAILYKLTLGRIFPFVFQKIMLFFFNVFKVFLKMVLTPVKLMYKIIYNNISLLFNHIRKLFSPLMISIFHSFKNIKHALKKS